jgi:hypothetical protein
LAAPEPFVILALPASGTAWFTNTWRFQFGRKLWHESLGIPMERQAVTCDFPPTYSIMTWKLDDHDLANDCWETSESKPHWLPGPKFRAYFYHTRNPLPQVYSLAALFGRMRSARPHRMLKPCSIKPTDIPLLDAMNLYVRFHERATRKTNLWYRVEDVEGMTNEMGKNVHNKDKTPSWDELHEVDDGAATALYEVAQELGYE